MPKKEQQKKTGVGSLDVTFTGAETGVQESGDTWEIITDLDSTVQRLKEDQIAYEKKVNEQINRLQEKSDRTVETIGIFAALLSFIAFEAQIFKGDLSAPTLIGLTALILGALLMFIYSLDLAFGKSRESKDIRKRRFYLLFFSASLVLVGIICALFGYWTERNLVTVEELESNLEQSKIDTKEIIVEQVEKANERTDSIEHKVDEINSKDQTYEFKECIKQRGLNNCL